MKKTLILAIIWLSIIGLTFAQDVVYNVSGEAIGQEASFKVWIKIHNPNKQIAGIQARLSLPAELDVVSTRPLNQDGTQAGNKMTFAGQPQINAGVSTRVIAYLAVGDQLAPAVDDFNFFEIILKLHDNTPLVAGQQFAIKLDLFKTSDRNQVAITSNGETSTVVVVTPSNPPEYQTISFSGNSGYPINPRSGQFMTKLLIDNPTTLVDSVVFELEYSDPYGLGYSLNNLVIRNPDGSSASSDYWSSKNILESGVNKHRWQIVYVAKNSLAPAAKFSFLEMYFSLTANHYQAGDNLRLSIKNIVVKPHNKKIIINPIPDFMINIGVEPYNEPDKDTVIFSANNALDVYPDSKNLVTNLDINNRGGDIDSITFTVEYGNPNGLGFGLSGYSTLNSDGSSASSEKLIKLDTLNFSYVRHSIKATYIALTPLTKAPNFNFLKMYFYIFNNNYHQGDIINIYIKDIKVMLTDKGKQVVVMPTNLSLAIEVKGHEAIPTDSISFSLKQGYKINTNQDQCPQFLGKMSIINPQKKLIDSVVMEFEYKDLSGIRYELYGAGSRYPNGTEANDRYWTWLTDLEKGLTSRRQRLVFETGNQPLADDAGIELYFKFTDRHIYRPGDVISIKMTVTQVVAHNKSEIIKFNKESWLYIVFESSFTSVEDDQLLIDYLSCQPSIIDNFVKVKYKSLLEANLGLYNLKGMLLNNLGSVIGEGTKVLNSSQLPVGMYFIIMTSANKQTLFKIFKQ